MNENIMKFSKRQNMYNGYLFTGNMRFNHIITPFVIKTNLNYDLVEVEIPNYTDEITQELHEFITENVRQQFGGR